MGEIIRARATNHVGGKGRDGRRKGSSRHNFREFPEETKEPGKSVIDRALTQSNLYCILGKDYDLATLQEWYKSSAFVDTMTKQAFRYRADERYKTLSNSQKVELLCYDTMLKNGIAGQHKRNAARGQNCLNRTALDILLSNKTQPEESILQIGNKDYCPVTAEELWGIYKDYQAAHNRKYGGRIKMLDAVMHVDEPTGTIHIHERKAYVGTNTHGEPCINKDSALASYGIQRPDMTKPAGRYNNRKMSYTADCRQMWLDICLQHGLDLETEPRVYADRHGLELTEYKAKQEERRLADLKHDADIMQEQQDEVDQMYYVFGTLEQEYPEYLQEVLQSWAEEQETSEPEL